MRGTLWASRGMPGRAEVTLSVMGCSGAMCDHPRILWDAFGASWCFGSDALQDTAPFPATAGGRVLKRRRCMDAFRLHRSLDQAQSPGRRFDAGDHPRQYWLDLHSRLQRPSVTRDAPQDAQVVSLGDCYRVT